MLSGCSFKQMFTGQGTPFCGLPQQFSKCFCFKAAQPSDIGWADPGRKWTKTELKTTWRCSGRPGPPSSALVLPPNLPGDRGEPATHPASSAKGQAPPRQRRPGCWPQTAPASSAAVRTGGGQGLWGTQPGTPDTGGLPHKTQSAIFLWSSLKSKPGKRPPTAFQSPHRCFKAFTAAPRTSCSGPRSFPTLCDPMSYSLPGSSCPWDFPGKETGVGCHFLLPYSGDQTPCLLHWQADSLPLSHLESPNHNPIFCTFILKSWTLSRLGIDLKWQNRALPGGPVAKTTEEAWVPPLPGQGTTSHIPQWRPGAAK